MRILPKLTLITILFFIVVIFATLSGFGLSDEVYGKSEGNNGNDGNGASFGLLNRILRVPIRSPVVDLPVDGISVNDVPVGCGVAGVVPENLQLCGFAWGATNEGSDTGVGWLSFNSKNCDTLPAGGDGINDNPLCGTVGSPTPRYGVVLGPHPLAGPGWRNGPEYTSNNYLRGCAWSPNIGWVKFGGFKVAPIEGNLDGTTVNVGKIRNDDYGIYGQGCSAGGSPPVWGWFSHGGTCGNSRLLPTGGLQGWARACVATPSGDCSDNNENTINALSGGWDGWIALAGYTENFASSIPHTATNNVMTGMGISTTTQGTFVGNSWGGDVVGWMNWGGNGPSTGLPGGGNVRLCSVTLPGFDISPISPIDVQPNTAFNIPVPVNLFVPIGYSFPSSGVTLSRSNPSGINSGFSGLNTTQCSSPSSCTNTNTLNVTSSGLLPNTSHTVVVTGSAAGLASVNRNIVINVEATPPPPSVLDLNCPTGTIESVVNQPASFIIDVETTPAAPSFDVNLGNLGNESDWQTVGGSPLSLSKTYTTIGNKTLQVGVRESSPCSSCVPPLTDRREGFCTVNFRITVDPDIIER